MLVPAVTKKDELEGLFAQHAYTYEYFLYMGHRYAHELPDIRLEDGVFQFAIVDVNRVIGYFNYEIDPETDTASNFGLYSFCRGNPLIGIDVFKEMNRLVNSCRRVQWRMIGGNPVKRHYDRFCEKYGGNCVVLHDVLKSPEGAYVDEYIYEIVSNYGKG